MDIIDLVIIVGGALIGYTIGEIINIFFDFIIDDKK